MNINNQIFFFFYNFAHQSLFLDKIIIFIAHTLPYLIIVLAGIFLFWHHEVFPSANPIKEFKKKWKEIVLVFFSGIFAWCVASLIKIIVATPRPFLVLPQVVPLLDKSDFSFPSGHATFYIALGFAIFLSHKKVGFWFIFFAVLMSLARIVAGVHFPIDILAGFLIGIVIAYLVRYFYEKRSIKKQA